MFPISKRVSAPTDLSAPAAEFLGSAQLASPPAAASFQALGDDSTSIPPDTMGAVGPNHLMVTLNSQVRIQNRSGGVLSTVSLNSFWTPVGGAPDVFDPKLAYDPFNNRWIFAAAANGDLASSAVLVGVSQTSDPTGTWFLYKVTADSGGSNWADYPTLGFTKDWIVVSVNMFSISSGSLTGVNIYAFNKTNLCAHGAGLYTRLQDTSGIGFTICPAVSYDNSLPAAYLVEDYDGTAGQLRISRITGTVGAEILTLGYATATGPSTWGQGGTGNFLPQAGTSQKIDGGDSRLMNCVYRNGTLWTAQTAFLPTATPTRTAAQWWQFTTNGTVLQFGRMDDPSGVQYFAYPSIALNKNNDVLVGYSRFSANQYASANYACHAATDMVGTLRDDTVLKAGEGCYNRKFTGADNRWGDFSSTVVDPINDAGFWTIQEYAATPVGGCGANTGHWGTWWGRIEFGAVASLTAAVLVAEGCTPTNGVIDPGETVTVSFTLANGGTVNLTNLVATLQASNGVTSPGSPQSYGAMPVGGASVTRSFTFTANGACGGSLTATLTLQDGTNSLGTVSTNLQLGRVSTALAESFDGVSAPNLPAGWSATVVTGTAWRTSSTLADTSPNAVFAADPAVVSDNQLTAPSIPIATTNATLSFRHSYALESSFDGGVLEVSIGAGAFTDILAAGGVFSSGGYNAPIATGFSSPIAGRSAWSGTSGGFITTVAILPASCAGQSVRLRWRCASDSSTSGTGWYVDTISLTDGYVCCRSLVAPSIVSPHRAGTNLTFSYTTVTSQTYFVESKTNLVGTNWTPLQTNPGSGSLKSFTNSTTSDRQRYFRLRTQ